MSVESHAEAIRDRHTADDVRGITCTYCHYKWPCDDYDDAEVLLQASREAETLLADAIHLTEFGISAVSITKIEAALVVLRGAPQTNTGDAHA